MAKGKEPPGLRRYRLAKKRKARGSKPRTRTVRRKAAPMARRRRYSRKKGRRKGKPAISLLAMAPAYPVIVGVYSKVKVGDFERIPNTIVHQSIGMSLDGEPWDQAVAMRQLGLAVGGIVGHKVANKLGVNRYLKKATGGWIVL